MTALPPAAQGTMDDAGLLDIEVVDGGAVWVADCSSDSGAYPLEAVPANRPRAEMFAHVAAVDCGSWC